MKYYDVSTIVTSNELKERILTTTDVKMNNSDK